jgi:FKBP-type peptidyl-prolyl cis-trans isomerase
MYTTQSGLEYTDLKQGSGEPATRGDVVVVHYTGSLTDGKEFDSSLGGQPFSFKLGVGEVIAGWDEGVAGMKVGGKRKLWIPAVLGYGRRGSPPEIPPNAELVFEVELLAIQK